MAKFGEVRSVSRGFGGLGRTLALCLNDGFKLEMRFGFPRFRETEAYILERLAARSPFGCGSPVLAGPDQQRIGVSPGFQRLNRLTRLAIASLLPQPDSIPLPPPPLTPP